ncbi:hypothetical protein [Actinocrispum wychmicini]|uniref:Uncharacterized protein n=1 Tax=Actinocrispum wychmicini TaxID=1213861 RepID=A0A4V2S7S4_9PSEU|nr:hypothetical protein [Actinocrispum wychmicini]TCO61070.1 hypothetical protein EV192_103654 [Actinocrispum wychmicini]
MTTISLTPIQIMAGVGVLLVLLFVWRSSSRRAAADAARTEVRLMSLAGRVLFTAGLIVGVQWVVIARGGNGWVLLAVLGVPALFAAYALIRALAVTTYDAPRRRGGGRR